MNNHQPERAGLERLESQERLNGMPPEKLLSVAGLGNDDDILDIGAGGGYFTFSAAERTKGRVYAVDSSPYMLDVLRGRAKESAKTNVEVAEGTAEHLPLKDGVVDLAIASLLLHILSAPQLGIKEMLRVLRPGGRGLIVEWLHPRPDGKPGHRIPLETMRLYLEACGAHIVSVDFWADTFYSIVFRTPLPAS
ncbi:Methyltransferase domain-containing protein [Paenibacillus sophorae]|uniref:Class I SAM-dependent methyltransferase n=1 Tax=Paenibacillus sophorae TaxID=1333845 RepID=A0A1H8RTF3_9BACL|nr:class I SAM-dependent methyltransferase [Paenibacillus sophorae]QWU16984.1 class I SAM-dependent methyltransferase [Paenibacillus sophorae]SEO69741.1 Methyltransferase domain-containing protein [Paenibacillus sophorae]